MSGTRSWTITITIDVIHVTLKKYNIATSAFHASGLKFCEQIINNLNSKLYSILEIWKLKNKKDNHKANQ